ncbi:MULTISPECIES: ATP-dependent nuclease [Thalassospira]|jgi:putative ATP-dependent endonuclease of OLD family|uniref:ATP-dependent endonuclease n=1 Tax=Thalassospira xiamenensis TaxID=220697 RepID=A0ABR5XY46_9PROT|nr:MULTISPECIES: AAA family ATPase [Thalassospira]MAL28393.1 ATP-dependent endonuclease [Thalassospira sp.]MBR9781479.1 AAA family ATPase [Rhodospirillales bacterium]KZD00574.1 ATP-dependent endonuclease [Thalassospira xiamenensis]KZD11578.1 ATP-dependent endonuclease [Thalassospira xiamenensis]MBL4841093.1 AAA family ATPase [Thalassospira sp.]|tara:strand:+ start:8022 stop:9899 length:1878 start_codon:yes stop_codon:yes gene_type:complete
MRVCRIDISHFRGINTAKVLLPKHAVLIGDNNTGKTTILEALDLALGPDRLNRFPPIDEHDFHQGKYLVKASDDSAQAKEVLVSGVQQAAAAVAVEGQEAERAEAPLIEVEVSIVDLSEEQKARFGEYVEFWDTKEDKFYDDPAPEGIDPGHITEALRVTFHGWYDSEEDDFQGKTYFTRSLSESGSPVEFRKKDKQVCGFLYLRSLRTGSRALSLERGSLLDIILRLKEVRPQMWEDTIGKLAEFTVAEDPRVGISGVLESINTALKNYVPKEWGVQPHLKVSNLTREHLRKVITAFIATGEGNHAAPFYRQGTGTINMLVLAMLSQIAAGKQNVIFAMEEPETAIPPYAQKRIVHEVRSLASQAIFTSHSPYVLEEFDLSETVVLGRDAAGNLTRQPISLPENLKLKAYRQDFRTRFCEGLLSRRVLIAEGETETTAFPVVCRRLAELNPADYKSLEALGICTLNAGSDSKIANMAKLFRSLGKRTFALCDKQSAESEALINAEVELLLMHEKKRIEDLVLEGTTDEALNRFAGTLEWPPHIQQKYPDPIAESRKALADYFSWAKGNWGLADFLAQCDEAEIPQWLREACKKLMEACDPVPADGDVDSTPDDAELEAAAHEAN